MADLASMHYALDNIKTHDDALAMQERVLEFRRRVLSENHPDIGEGRCVLWACIVLIVTRGCLPDVQE